MSIPPAPASGAPDTGGEASPSRGREPRCDRGPARACEPHTDAESTHFPALNPAQRRAVLHGLPDPGSAGIPPPLLIIAGAGTGKTTTLAHRVAECVLRGTDPGRILLLTFTRRAAREMTRRAERIVAQATRAAVSRRRIVAGSLRWAGTFHAVANRLLRLHADSIGLEACFTVLDRTDAEDLLDVVRHQQGLSRQARRFPRKRTCLAVYSRCVNTSEPLPEVLEHAFPWCREWEDELRRLFRGYVEAKQQRSVLDFDDLLLCWHHLMQEPALARRVAARFDRVLVDEYQDTNALQATILAALCPQGHGLTVVGDDAQAIYAFRAATVRNILDFPHRFDPPAETVTLQQNYRSVEPILEAANCVIGYAAERYTKDLFSERPSQQKPRLVAVEDEAGQADYIVERVLAAREEGLALRDQAVLFRTLHHSDLLQVELARRNIPFVVYGGLRFLEAAHVKDLLCVLRWAENPRDGIAAFRVLQLFAGIGPAAAQRIFEAAAALARPAAAGARPAAGQRIFDAATSTADSGASVPGADGERAALPALGGIEPPAAAREDWPAFVELMVDLTRDGDWPGQVGMARSWDQPHLERLYDAPQVRAGDLEQIEIVAAQYPSRERFLAEVTLDPPAATGDLAGVPWLDEDYLILSTIHSAKGQEWDHVYVMNLVDGCIPSDMATGSADEIEEERRLLYVAMTRARDELDLIQPLRFYVHRQRPHGDRHLYAPRSRFLPDVIVDRFERIAHGIDADADAAPAAGAAHIDVSERLRDMW